MGKQDNPLPDEIIEEVINGDYTWGEIKQLFHDAGVEDDDFITIKLTEDEGSSGNA